MAPWIDSSRKPFGGSIACRLALPMLSEATRILEEGKVRDAREIDLAVVFGLGFPAEKGGLLWWAESLGPDRILSLLPPQRRVDDVGGPALILHALPKAGDGFYPVQT